MELQEWSKKIAATDTVVVAISTDGALDVSRTVRELGIRFRLISDPHRRVIRLYGVLHPTQDIARPAVFIIDKRGVIRYRYVGANYADRPSVETLLRTLAWL